MENFHARRWSQALIRQPPVFARSVFTALAAIDFTSDDRIAPIIDAASRIAPAFSAVWMETPDSNEGKTRSGLGRRLLPLLERAMQQAGLLAAASAAGPRLHVVFTGREHAYVGSSDAASGSRWPMGIPRLRMPHGAPSRSTLKLAEAFVTFLGEQEPQLVRAGLRAVDLGAAPGGWTWQLASRGLRVVAVDNASLKGEVASDPLVTHLREDGLTYRPRRPVEWMVCDIVEQPARIAALVARWIAEGDARRSIFNLKLPMKRRYDEMLQCRASIAATLAKAGVRHTLALRQLYHDREEITGYVARHD